MTSDRLPTLPDSWVVSALRDCYDPQIPCNIVDLGLVNAIDITEDRTAPGAGIAGLPVRHRVVVDITPSTPDEAQEAQLSAQIQNRLAGLEAVSHSAVVVRHSPGWTPARITSAGRRTLGLEGNPALVQIR